MGEGKVTPLTTLTPLNRQSPNAAHVITSTISPHRPHGSRSPQRLITSPHIAKVTTQLKKNLSLYAKSVYRPRAQAAEPILLRDTPANGQGSAFFWGVRKQYFHIFALKAQTPKKTILGTYNGKPTGNTYSHNCIMMHKDTTLKFGWLYNLSKYLEHT